MTPPTDDQCHEAAQTLYMARVRIRGDRNLRRGEFVIWDAAHNRVLWTGDCETEFWRQLDIERMRLALIAAAQVRA